MEGLGIFVFSVSEQERILLVPEALGGTGVSNSVFPKDLFNRSRYVFFIYTIYMCIDFFKVINIMFIFL